jgi:FHA domain
MSETCPAGHVTASGDYCDTCGLELPGAAQAGSPQPNSPQPNSPSRQCPWCGEGVGVDDSFCESCGCDLGSEASSNAGWQAVISVDLSYARRLRRAGGGEPPEPFERVILLATDRVTLGRATSDGEVPDLDLSLRPADPGVSRGHAILERKPDDTWTVTDCHSRNGTYLNDNIDPLPQGQAVELCPGDRLHVGGWTTVVLRRFASE